MELENDFGSIDKKESYDVEDIGLAYGIGVKFPLNDNTRLFIEYDAQLAFLDVFDSQSFGENIVSSNRRSAFNIGILFDLQKKKNSQKSPNHYEQGFFCEFF